MNRILVFSIISGVVLCPALALDVPADGFVPGWSAQGQPQIFDGNGLYGHIDGGAELFLEFGFDALRIQNFVHRKDEGEIALEIYGMESPEAALGIYLMKCGRETRLEGIGARHTGDERQIMALKGRYFLLVNNLSGQETILPVMIRLMDGVMKSIPDERLADHLAILPDKDRIEGSERLIRGMYSLQSLYTLGEEDILLLDGKIFGAAADYTDPTGTNYTRIMIRYPDAAYAGRAFTHLRDNLDPYLEIQQQKASFFSFKDYQQKFGTVTLKNDTLTIQVHLPTLPF